MQDVQFLKSLRFIFLCLIFLLAPIGSSFYKYFYTKNYDYLIEAKCNPSIEKCFLRDCKNSVDCPPNGLSVYKEFYIKAYDFHLCSQNSCEKECSQNLITCIPIECGNSQDDNCTNYYDN